MKKCVLGDVADVIVSGVDKKTKDGEEKVRLCNYTDVYYNWAITSAKHDGLMEASAKPEEIRKFKIRKGQVALTKDSETRDDIGIPTYIADDFEDVILGYHCALITPYDKQLDGSYLNALLRTKYAKEFFANNAGGSGQRYYLSDASIKELPLFLPDFAEQKRIGKFFSSIDRKIALNRKRIATLEAMAKEIYDYWFVQFDFPDAHGRPYKSSGGAMVYDPDLKREIPKEWEVSEIGSLAEIKSGYPFRSDALIENGVHGVITIKNVQDYQLDLSQLCYINEIPEGVPGFCRIQNGACLMSLTGYVGRICRVHKVGFLLNQRVGVVIPKVENREWLYAMLGERGLRAKINYLATGCAQANVSPVDIGKIRVPFPTSELRNRYDEIAKCLTAEIFACRKECDELASLRDFLLPVLMNGQVKVG